MCGDDDQVCGDSAPSSVSAALRMADTGLEYLNSPAADELEIAALGDALTALRAVGVSSTGLAVVLIGLVLITLCADSTNYV